MGDSDSHDVVDSCRLPFSNGSFHAVVSYINAEGKARETVERRSKDWLCIFISEADFLDLEGRSDTFVGRHMCI